MTSETIAPQDIIFTINISFKYSYILKRKKNLIHSLGI